MTPIFKWIITVTIIPRPLRLHRLRLTSYTLPYFQLLYTLFVELLVLLPLYIEIAKLRWTKTKAVQDWKDIDKQKNFIFFILQNQRQPLLMKTYAYCTHMNTRTHTHSHKQTHIYIQEPWRKCTNTHYTEEHCQKSAHEIHKAKTHWNSNQSTSFMHSTPKCT